MRAARHTGRNHAFTLAEMLVVMSIAAIMGTLAVVSFIAIGRRAAREGAAEDVSGLLRSARLSAVDSGQGAVVRVNPVERTIYGLSRRVQASWHFEQMAGGVTPGSRRMDGQINGNPTVEEGAVGLSLEFDGTGDWVDCDSYPIFDQTDGVRLEADVMPQGGIATNEFGLMGKGGAGDGYAVWLRCETSAPRRTYSAHGRFYIDDPIDHIDLDSGGVTLPEGKWSTVAVEYDGYEARLYVNGVVVDLDSYREPEDAPTNPDYTPNPQTDPVPGTDVEFDPGTRLEPARGSNLEIGRAAVDGGPVEYFSGRIDEPRFLTVAGGRRVELAERVPIVTTDEAIYFDGQGYLDLAHHTGPVYVAVGDPYQSAPGSISLPAGPITLVGQNPFPDGGGLVIYRDYLVQYNNVNGADLEVADAQDLRQVIGGTDDDVVRWARMVRIGQTGIVERVEAFQP